MSAERLLVNFFHAQPVGHAVEALHDCLGHHPADPGRRVSQQALADYFRALLAAHDGDASAIWSIDGVHLDHLSR